MEDALHLPKMGAATLDSITNAALFAMVKQLGYNGEFTKFGSLFRTKLKQEWNFFFDTITRCFMNKTSNFDALPRGSIKIGYSLIHSKCFDFGSFILKYLSERKTEKHGFVCYIRFLRLIFSHMCPDVVFESDQILPIFKITDNNIKILKSSDKANGFEGNAFIPDEAGFSCKRECLLSMELILMLWDRAKHTLFLTKSSNPHTPNTYQPPLLSLKRQQL